VVNASRPGGLQSEDEEHLNADPREGHGSQKGNRSRETKDGGVENEEFAKPCVCKKEEVQQTRLESWLGVTVARHECVARSGNTEKGGAEPRSPKKGERKPVQSLERIHCRPFSSPLGCSAGGG